VRLLWKGEGVVGGCVGWMVTLAVFSWGGRFNPKRVGADGGLIQYMCTSNIALSASIPLHFNSLCSTFPPYSAQLASVSERGPEALVEGVYVIDTALVMRVAL